MPRRRNRPETRTHDKIAASREITGIWVSQTRHLELLRGETNRQRRQYRKMLGFPALYGSDPRAKVFLPVDYVEPSDIFGAETTAIVYAVTCREPGK